VARLDSLLARCRAWERPLSLAVVGGGAGGVELALALQHRLEQERLAAGQPGSLRAQVRCAPDGQARASLLRCAAPPPGGVRAHPA
jgi:selenide,water dikinase